MSILWVTSDGRPGVIVDTSGAGTVLSTPAFFSIQEGVRLPTGEICTCVVNVLGALNIYTWNGSTSVPVFTLANVFAGGNVLPGYGLNINGANFWGLLNTNVLNASFYKFSNTGVILNTVGPVTASGTGTPMCVAIDESVGYWVNNSTNTIKRWNLLTNAAMADLVTFNANWFVDGMWNVQGSTDIVVVFNNFGAVGDNTRIIVRYTNAGVVVYNVTFYTIPAPFDDDFSEDALSIALDAIWTRNAAPPSYDMTVSCRYQRVLIADGSVTNFVDIPVTAANAPGTTCFLMELVASASFAGLYFIDPGHRHDSYYSGDVKIPNPTARTALIGE